MIGIIFNFDMRDEPYNQNAASKAFRELETLIEGIGEKVYYSFGNKRDEFFYKNTDEFVIVYYTYNLTLEQKQLIAQKINEILTLKKSIYGKETLDKLIVFNKKEVGDCFTF